MKHESSAGSNDVLPLPPITCRYLLAITIPLFRDSDGRTYADQLWFKDLAEHLSYLTNFTLACPLVDQTPPANAVPLDSDDRFANVKFVYLPSPRNEAQAILLLPITISRLWRAVRSADIVHSGVGGWPVPFGWIVTPIARLLRKPSLIIVESAAWRLQSGLPAKLTTRLRAGLYERLARWCMTKTDLAIFTHEEYRRSLPPNNPEKGHVIHASWIDEDVILSDRQAAAIWRQKMPPACELKVLFAGRLDPEKGVLVLLEALKDAAKSNAPIRLDILGTGILAGNCGVVSAELSGLTRVVVLGTVPYGPPLFSLLQQYHAIVVPSISDEQPRIVYDAYSQGVPALASDTAGLRDCIFNGQTGWLVEPNNSAALSNILQQASMRREELQKMGMRALTVARTLTHQRMHHIRQRLLLQLLSQPTKDDPRAA